MISKLVKATLGAVVMGLAAPALAAEGRLIRMTEPEQAEWLWVGAAMLLASMFFAGRLGIAKFAERRVTHRIGA